MLSVSNISLHVSIGHLLSFNLLHVVRYYIFHFSYLSSEVSVTKTKKSCFIYKGFTPFSSTRVMPLVFAPLSIINDFAFYL